MTADGPWRRRLGCRVVRGRALNVYAEWMTACCGQSTLTVWSACGHCRSADGDVERRECRQTNLQTPRVIPIVIIIIVIIIQTPTHCTS